MTLDQVRELFANPGIRRWTTVSIDPTAALVITNLTDVYKDTSSRERQQRPEISGKYVTTGTVSLSRHLPVIGFRSDTGMCKSLTIELRADYLQHVESVFAWTSNETFLQCCQNGAGLACYYYKAEIPQTVLSMLYEMVGPVRVTDLSTDTAVAGAHVVSQSRQWSMPLEHKAICDNPPQYAEFSITVQSH